MSKVSEYGFTNAKLRARIGDIRSSSLVEDMIHASTLAEAVSKLDGTRHQGAADIYRRTGDLQQVEMGLLEEEVELYETAASHLPKAAAGYVMVLLEKVEIDNLKNAIRLWYAGAVRHHQLKYRTAYISHKRMVHEIDYDKITNATKWAEVVAGVSGTPYEAVMQGYDEKSMAGGGLFRLEIDLDHLWFRHVDEGLSRLKGEDRSIASSISSIDVDLKNILMLTRYGYYYHLGPQDLKKVIIPYGYIAQEAIEKNAMDSDDPVGVLRGIVQKRYPKISAEILRIRRSADDLTARAENGAQILEIEAYLGKTRADEYRKLLLAHPFSIGVTLCYFYLSRQENALISAVLSAKYYKWDERDLREELGI